MNDLKELTVYNFVTDLYFHPERAREKEKSLALSVVFGILSLGAIPAAVAVIQGICNAVSCLSKESPREEKIRKVFHENRPRQPTLVNSESHLLPQQMKSRRTDNQLSQKNRVKTAKADSKESSKNLKSRKVKGKKEPSRACNVIPVGEFDYNKEPKGTDKLEHVVPKGKELGTGAGGKVYLHKLNPDLAIKVIKNKTEYEIGRKLNHPTLTKTHALFNKHYPKAKDRQDPIIKHKLVMDTVDGKNVHKYQDSNDTIAKDLAIKLIEQAKECCIYLFDNKVIWKDVNDGNIFVESGTQDLKLIDFGHWEENIDDPKKRVKELLLGAMELNGWIVGNSSCTKKSKNDKNRELKRELAFPKAFFGEQINANQIMSLNNTWYLEASWMKKIDNDIAGKNDDELKAYISAYFDAVIGGLRNAKDL